MPFYTHDHWPREKKIVYDLSWSWSVIKKNPHHIVTTVVMHHNVKQIETEKWFFFIKIIKLEFLLFFKTSIELIVPFVDNILFGMISFIFRWQTYLGSLSAKSGWPTHTIHFWSCRFPYHFLMHFMPCSRMVTHVLGDQVSNGVGLSFTSPLMRYFRKRWSWLLVTSHWYKSASKVKGNNLKTT